jgi:hypothetical protein
MPSAVVHAARVIVVAIEAVTALVAKVLTASRLRIPQRE